MLAHGGGGGRKAPEIPKVMGRAPLWNFNPRQLMGGAGGTPSQAGGELLVVVTGSGGEFGRGQISLRWGSHCFWLSVRDCSQGYRLTQ